MNAVAEWMADQILALDLDGLDDNQIAEKIRGAIGHLSDADVDRLLDMAIRKSEREAAALAGEAASLMLEKLFGQVELTVCEVA